MFNLYYSKKKKQQQQQQHCELLRNMHLNT